MDAEEIVRAKRKWERDGVLKWDFGRLPDFITVSGRGGAVCILHPSLVSEEDGKISIRLIANRKKAILKHKQGVLSLFKVHFAKELKFLKKNAVLPPDSQQQAAFLGGKKNIEKSLFESVLKDFFYVNIREQNSFSDHAEKAKAKLSEALMKKRLLTIEILKAVYETRKTVFQLESDGGKNPCVRNICEKIRKMMSGLAPENFPELYENDRLANLPRYIQALKIRAQRAVVNPEKDALKASSINKYVNELEEIVKNLSSEDSEEKRRAVEDFFWLLEEFKVSVFAQELKTCAPVSEKRLNQKIEEIQRMV
jgi:ATP-dependent helicase HrpA